MLLIMFINCDSHHTISIISDPTMKHIRHVKTAIMSQVTCYCKATAYINAELDPNTWDMVILS